MSRMINFLSRLQNVKDYQFSLEMNEETSLHEEVNSSFDGARHLLLRNTLLETFRKYHIWRDGSYELLIIIEFLVTP